jgi:hypothetical protein
MGNYVVSIGLSSSALTAHDTVKSEVKFSMVSISFVLKNNKIQKLADANGNEITYKNQMHCLATEYFKGLYTANDTVQPSVITDLIQEKVTLRINEDLCAPFTDDEISFALF